MAVVVRNRKGREVVLYNPAEKSQFYATELRNGAKRNGKELNASQASFRMGYLQARADNASAYNSTNGLVSNKRKRVRRIPSMYDKQFRYSQGSSAQMYLPDKFREINR